MKDETKYVLQGDSPLGCGCGARHDPGPGGMPPDPAPDTDPCSACGYNKTTKQLSGRIKSDWTGGTLKNMTLTLKNSSGDVLGTYGNLPGPDGDGFYEANEDIANTINTSYTTTVATAWLRWQNKITNEYVPSAGPQQITVTS